MAGKGGYAITFFGGSMTLWGISKWFDFTIIAQVSFWGAAIFALITAIYTAFLFAQAKGRDFWQSPTLSLHMLSHSFIAGAAVFAILTSMGVSHVDWTQFIKIVLYIGVGFNLLVMLFELGTSHPTVDSQKTVSMILRGKYSATFWLGVVFAGNILPIILISFGATFLLLPAGIFLLLGIYLTEHIWVQAPQQIPLS